VVDELLEKYGETSESPEKQFTPAAGKEQPPSADPETLKIQAAQQSMADFSTENTMRYEDLKLQLAALQEETSLDEMAVAHGEYEMKVRGLLDSVQQRKADIIAEYQEKMRVAAESRSYEANYLAVAANEASARSQIEMLQQECQGELAQAQAYEARILKELGEVKAVSVGDGATTAQGLANKVNHVEFLAAALDTQEQFVKARLQEIQDQVDSISMSRAEERAQEAEARGLVQSYSAMLEQERKTSEEAKGAYVEEAYRVEKAEAEVIGLAERNSQLEATVKRLELELTAERSARAMAELKASAGF